MLDLLLKLMLCILLSIFQNFRKRNESVNSKIMFQPHIFAESLTISVIRDKSFGIKDTKSRSHANRLLTSLNSSKSISSPYSCFNVLI